MFEPFQKFIKYAANKQGMTRQIEAASVCQDFRAILPKLFEGKEQEKEQIENYIKPAYFKNSVLVVSVENQAWGQEVIMRKEKIIEEMNRKAGCKIIKNLRTQLR